MCLFTMYVSVCVFGIWCICMLVCVVLGACTCMSVSVEARGQHQVSFSVAFHLNFLECEPLSLRVTNSAGAGWPGSSRDGNLLVSASLVWDCRSVLSLGAGDLNSGLRLCSKHFTTEASL